MKELEKVREIGVENEQETQGKEKNEEGNGRHTIRRQ